MVITLQDGTLISAEPEGRALHLEISRVRGAWLSADEVKKFAAQLLVLAESLDPGERIATIRQTLNLAKVSA
jgi:hypothetical protein